VRRILRTHSLLSTRLPLADGRIVTVRKPGLPDADQAHIYGMLGIDWKKMCPATKSEKYEPIRISSWNQIDIETPRRNLYITQCKQDG